MPVDVLSDVPPFRARAAPKVPCRGMFATTSPETLMRPLAAALLAPVALASLAACGSAKKRRGPVEPDSATLEVSSNYIGPVDVFVLRDNGLRVRLASNVGSRVQRVVLGPTIIGGAASIRIIAVPIADRGVASTGAIVVRPGNTVEFTVAPNLAASTVFIR